MRTEQEMLDLIISTAREDERIRAVYMNGSRANPNAPRDMFQDFDIVYVVKDVLAFAQTALETNWIDRFGVRVMYQIPDEFTAQRAAWLILFADGNRIDMNVQSADHPDMSRPDSETILLLDKDGLLPALPSASDRDYWTEPPKREWYDMACNDFWWCLQNCAKGIRRDELPYVKGMFGYVREKLDEMVAWRIGMEYDFQISTGKMGKYFKRYLPSERWAQYCATYADSDYDDIWASMFAACELFRSLAYEVAERFDFTYPEQDDANMTAYLCWVRKLA